MGLRQISDNTTPLWNREENKGISICNDDKTLAFDFTKKLVRVREMKIGLEEK